MPAKSPEAIARKRANDRGKRSQRARNYLNNSAYNDREMVRNQGRHHRESVIKRLNPIAIDGEAGPSEYGAHYSELRIVSDNQRDAIETDGTTPLALEHVVPALKRWQGREKRKLKNSFNDNRFYGFAIGYDGDKWIGGSGILTPEQKHAIAQQMKKSYGRVQQPGWRREVDIPQMGISIYRGKKQIVIYYWDSDEKGYIFDDNGVPVYKKYNTTVNDVFSLFAKKFETVCADFLAHMEGPEYERYNYLFTLIQEGKKQRGSSTAMWKDRARRAAYNYAELEWLLYIVKGVQAASIALELSPHELNSPASLTRAALTKYAVKRHVQPEWYSGVEFMESEEFQFIRRAQFAGRIEQCVQAVLDECYEYDINSAYPSFTRNLPCMAHGHFRWLTDNEIVEAQEGRFYDWTIYEVEFHARPGTMWGPMPVRQPDNSTHFPPYGTGAYHTPEVKAAYAAGVKLRVIRGLQWVSECEQEHPFREMVDELYAQRILVSSDAPMVALVIKLALNSIYGCLAQVAGEAKIYDDTGAYTYKVPKTQNLFAAGYITSGTRAAVYTATVQNQLNVVATATDAIICRGPQPGMPTEKCTTKPLGGWDYKHIESPGFFLMPGVRIFENAKSTKIRGYRNPPTFATVKAAYDAGETHIDITDQLYITYDLWERQATDRPWGQFVEFTKSIDLTPNTLRAKRSVHLSVQVDGVTYYYPRHTAKGPSVAPRHITDKVKRKTFTIDEFEAAFDRTQDGVNYVP